MRVCQSLASSDATVTLKFIVPNFIDSNGSYSVYLSTPYVVTVLEHQGNQNSGVYIHGWFHHTKVPLDYGQLFQTKVCCKLQVKLFLYQQLVNLIIFG